MKSYFYDFISYDFLFSQKGDAYYGYNFQKTLYLDNQYGAYLDDFPKIEIEPKKTLLYLDENGRYNLVPNFTETRLA